MIENKISKTLRIIGKLTIILGIISSIILSIMIDYDFPITLIVGAIVSFVSGMFIVGFSEVIALLQEIINQQKEFLSAIKNDAEKNTANYAL